MKSNNRTQFRTSPKTHWTAKQVAEFKRTGYPSNYRASYVAKSKYDPTIEDAKKGRRQ